MQSLGGFPASISEFSNTFPEGREREARYLFPSTYMDSKFMNFVDNLIHQQFNGKRFVLSGEHAYEDDEPYFESDDYESIYEAARLHPILDQRNTSVSNRARFDRLFEPNRVRYYYSPEHNEFFDKSDMQVGANGKRIHPLLILISSSLTHYDLDLTHGDRYRFTENTVADYVGKWANQPLIALDDSLASMIFLSVKRAARIDLGYKHEELPKEAPSENTDSPDTFEF